MAVDKNKKFIHMMERYALLINHLEESNVATDAAFQKAYNAFYQVRRNAEWRQGYFSYLEENKRRKDISFDEILDFCFFSLKSNLGEKNPVEASFSSKMLAIINPNMPVIDSHVLESMNLSLGIGTALQKREKAKIIYRTICVRYQNYLGTKDCQQAVALFDNLYPQFTHISPVKKIDCFLWKCSKQEINAMQIFKSLTCE